MRSLATLATALALPLALAPPSAAALEFKFDGFLTAAAGTILEGSRHTQYQGYNCPCFVADYNNGSVYEENSVPFQPESRLGGQLTVEITPELKAIGQAVVRAVNGTPSLQWAYLSYKLNSNWTLQAGRKRIPIYYYSEFQDISQAYIWVRPPQQLYGWELSNYDGGSLRYNDNWEGWSINASVFGGYAEQNDTPYTRLYDTYVQDVKWQDLVGGDIEISRDWFTSRLMYLHSKNYITSKPDSRHWSTPTDQNIVGLALNFDFDTWFVLSEFNVNMRDNDHEDIHITAPAMSIGAGYRIGDFTPFINYSRYWEYSSNRATWEPERHQDLSFTLRYDITSSMDVKLQIEHFWNNSVSDWVGDATVFTATYDIVF
jgi:hypothetical protein